jgi:hypothetical protein
MPSTLALCLALLASLSPCVRSAEPRLSYAGPALTLSEAAPGATAEVVVSVADAAADQPGRLVVYWDGAQLNVTADAADFVAPGTSPHAALGSARDDSGVLPGCVKCGGGVKNNEAVTRGFYEYWQPLCAGARAMAWQWYEQ